MTKAFLKIRGQGSRPNFYDVDVLVRAMEIPTRIFGCTLLVQSAMTRARAWFGLGIGLVINRAGGGRGGQNRVRIQ